MSMYNELLMSKNNFYIKPCYGLYKNTSILTKLNNYHNS